MSAVATPTDNALIESFFSTLKREEVWLKEYQHVADAKAHLHHFLETEYNTERLHSSLGYRPPANSNRWRDDFPFSMVRTMGFTSFSWQFAIWIWERGVCLGEIAGDNGECDPGGKVWRVVDRLMGYQAVLPGGGSEGAAMVGIAIETGEVARGDLDPDPVARLKKIAGGPEIDLVFLDSARFEEVSLGGALAIASANDAVGQIAGIAIRMDIDQFGGEIGINGGRRREENDRDRPGDFNRLVRGAD